MEVNDECMITEFSPLYTTNIDNIQFSFYN